MRLIIATLGLLAVLTSCVTNPNTGRVDPDFQAIDEELEQTSCDLEGMAEVVTTPELAADIDKLRESVDDIRAEVQLIHLGLSQGKLSGLLAATRPVLRRISQGIDDPERRQRFDLVAAATTLLLGRIADRYTVETEEP